MTWFLLPPGLTITTCVQIPTNFKASSWAEMVNNHFPYRYRIILVIVVCLECFVVRQTSISWKSYKRGRCDSFFRDTTSPYDSLLKRGNFLPSSVHRIRCLGIEVYKCFRGLNPDYLNNLFKQSSTKYDMRDSCRLQQPKFNTFSYGQRSFRYCGSKLWNLLPYSVKNTKDLNVFKSNITRWCHSKQRDLLEVFWNNTRLPLCLYFIRPFIPLSIILDKYMSIYSPVFCLSPYTMYIY